MQAGQQAYLALTLESLAIDACIGSETEIHDSSSAIRLTTSNISRYFLHASEDETAQAMDQRGAGIIPNAPFKLDPGC